MKAMQNTTIAAVSTAYGEGGIGIVRISGPAAGGILCRLFGRDAAFDDRHMYYGHIVDPGDKTMQGENQKTANARHAGDVCETANARHAGDVREATSARHVGDVREEEIIDEVLAVLMHGPRTYTGEDVAEIHCHGSIVSLRRILDAALRCGAEPASPGEFTQRAFLNGRIDLAQAEAVIDIVRAKTERSASAAVAQLGGGLSQRIEEARNLLADALALAVVHIDYPDDDKDFRDEDSAQAQMTTGLRAASDQIAELIKTADTGRILREGLNVVIAGAANAGKSSLLNALLKESRAIVTAIPGTTRDSIEEQANIKGIPVRLTDTAGIRETDNEIEQIGIERARAALMDADLIVFLVDGSKEIDEDDIGALRFVKEEQDINLHRQDEKSLHLIEHTGVETQTSFNQPAGSNIVVAISKSDLPQAVTEESLEYLIKDAGLSEKLITPAPNRKKSRQGNHPNTICESEARHTVCDSGTLYTIHISATTGEGIPALEDRIEGAVYSGAAAQRDEPLVTNTRHKNLLTRAASEIEAATEQLTQTGNIDLAETNIRAAYDYLGEITGETATDDIIDRIFSRFCIGK
ncbi:MAG: tRNA uridine-5-carboxymethylaminomethyl(34) synthesis GTPase MnmE [Clostridiales Family XIII bacterium]|jgi:tRNA modification GTPase|nr:tRNA uridine-5-carboxymethylaminomethyl(34) synthesis GTPase MnmE [Clostridiales Family XIII bacterium]